MLFVGLIVGFIVGVASTGALVLWALDAWDGDDQA